MAKFEIEEKLKNVLFLSFSFVLIYTAYFSSLYLNNRRLRSYGIGDLSFTCLCVLYGFFCLFNFLSPLLIRRFGPINPLFVFSLFFGTFLFSYVIPYSPTLIIAAALAGAGSSVIWNCQGTLLTLNSCKQTLSRNNSIFRGLYQFSYLIGSIILIIMLPGIQNDEQFNKVLTKIYIVLTVIAFTGSLSIIFLIVRTRKMISEKKQNINDVEKMSQKDVLNRFLRVLINPRFFLVAPMFIWSGASLSMTATIIPSILMGRVVDQATNKSFYPSEMVGMYGITFSLCCIVSNFTLVMLSHRIKTIPTIVTIILGATTSTIAYSILFIMLDEKRHNVFVISSVFTKDPLIYALISAGLLGMTDSILSTRPATILGARFPKSLPEAFSGLKLFQTATQAFFYGMNFTLSFKNKFIIMVSLGWFAGTLCVSSLIYEKVKKGRMKQDTPILENVPVESPLES